MRGTIYALWYVPTGHVYIGATRDFWARSRHWRNALMRMEHGNCNGDVGAYFRRFARGKRATDWKFEFVEQFANIERGDFGRAEVKAIAEFREKYGDDKVLNIGLLPHGG